MSPHIMVYGNPLDGFRFVGPFETKRQAHTYATTESADAWVAELDAPAHEQARAHRQWTFVIKETAEGFNYETSCLGGGFSPTRKGLIEVIGRLIETYLPLPETPAKPTDPHLDKGVIRRMTCCVCGDDAGRWSQHWNRDHGFGICGKCVTWLRQEGRSTEEEILNLYGKEGVNWGLPS